MTESPLNMPSNWQMVSIRNDRIICVDIRLPNSSNSSTKNKKDFDENVPSLFFYHGSMATKAQFYSLVELLIDSMNKNDKKNNNKKDKRYKIILYDAYGCGYSLKPDNSTAYTTEELVADAIAVFDKYSSKKNKNIIVGHSFGTCIVARIAQEIENRNINIKRSNSNSNNSHIVPSLDGCILLGTALHKDRSWIFMLPVFILDCIHETLSQGFVKLAFSPSTSEETKKKCLEVNSKNLMNIVKYFYTNMNWANGDTWDALRRQCPSGHLLVLQGKDDGLTPPELATALCNKHFGGLTGCYHEITEAGHQLMQEQPHKCFQIMDDFIQKRFFGV